MPCSPGVELKEAKYLTFTETTEARNPLSAVSTASSIDTLRNIAIQAELRPRSIAIAAGDHALTYTDLDAQSSRLAQRLQRMGVDRNVPVAVCLPRSPEMVVAALGIMKAGAAYLPLDPDDPPDRLAFVLKDAGVAAVATTSALASKIGLSSKEALLMDSPGWTAESADPLDIDLEPEDLAYIIYTSGSTGRPKGVELTHAGLANLISWHQQAFSVTAEDRASHLAGLNFDAAVWELWPYLTTGASVHLVDDTTRTSPELLLDWLVRNEITVSFVPTPIAERMLFLDWPRTTSLRFLLTGGDRLRRYPPSSLPFRVINNYGPTECTVVATSGEVLPADPGRQIDWLPSIGKPIANTRIDLVDREGRSVSAPDSGEICISGRGVARGYRNQPALTAEKFVPDPLGEEEGRFMYKTGDLGRLLPSGEIEFLGRLDDQIKVRGYRIEPGDVIASLGQHPSVRECLVVTQEDSSGELELAAYVVLNNEHVTSTQLRQFLRTRLPEYMIPSVFVRIDAFPLTTRGKIDRSRLPRPEPANILADEVTNERALSSTEQRIAEIAAHLLGRETISPDDNFFLLGGHSLLGAQLISQLRSAFGVDIPLRTLFRGPTTTQLAREIELLAGARVVAGHTA